MPSRKRLQVYWNPFAERENDPNVDLSLRQTEGDFRRKWNCRIVAKAPNFLAGVKPYEILLIDGHGNGGVNLFSRENPPAESLSVAAIALMIQLGKLPTNHVLIKLLGCRGYLCAQALAQVLRPQYPNIIVGGYTHPVIHGIANRAEFVLPDLTMVSNWTGSQYVRWYDAHGNAAIKPQRPTFVHYQDHEAYDPDYPTCDLVPS